MAENGIRQLGPPRIGEFSDRITPEPLHLLHFLHLKGKMADVCNVTEEIAKTTKDNIDNGNSVIDGNEYYKLLDEFFTTYDSSIDVKTKYALYEKIKDSIRSIKKSKKRADVVSIFKKMDRSICLLTIQTSLDELVKLNISEKKIIRGNDSYSIVQLPVNDMTTNLCEIVGENCEEQKSPVTLMPHSH